MRLPIKLNSDYWPKALENILPSSVDPRILCHNNVDETIFSKAISTFKFGNTFKTTRNDRSPLSITELCYLVKNTQPIILDIGASDGSTSLNVIRSIPFARYYVTDLNIQVWLKDIGRTTYFYDNEGRCILAVTDKFIIYADTDSALFPFGKIAKSVINKGLNIGDNLSKIILINPALQAINDNRIIIKKYDLFQAWPYEKVDVIIAANILNKAYFDDSNIIQALKNMVSVLNEKGLIAIIDNRPDEKASIFKYVGGKIMLKKRINAGSDIEGLVLTTLG